MEKTEEDRLLIDGYTYIGLLPTRGKKTLKLRRIEPDRCQWQIKEERDSVRYEQIE